jgi:hypothetical protein
MNPIEGKITLEKLSRGWTTSPKVRPFGDRKSIESIAIPLAEELGFHGLSGQIAKNAALKTIARAENKERRKRKVLLEQLANLSLDHAALKRMLSTYDPEEQLVIAVFQAAIRKTWSRETSVAVKQLLLNAFVDTAIARSKHSMLSASLAIGNIAFPACNLSGQIVSGILENWTSMAVCKNPECAAPYFWAKRSTQNWCEHGECTKYAQRKKAREWWNENRSNASIGKGKAE